jgi:FKBP-type peptidyl-prolyl cis-trans isomerase FklB
MLHYPVAVLAVLLAGCQSNLDADRKLASAQDSLSYSLGRSIGARLVMDSVNISTGPLLQGILDARADSSRQLLTEQQIKSILAAFQDSMTRRQVEMGRLSGEKNRMEGEAFLAENGKKPGVVTLPSGLQYKVMEEGTGKKPTASSTVKTHYAGRLLDGTEFDSSFKRGEPAEFQVGGVIRGWTEALQLMKEGSTWELYIPSSLGYGDRGAGGVIPPNATLIFKVQLISVN